MYEVGGVDQDICGGIGLVGIGVAVPDIAEFVSRRDKCRVEQDAIRGRAGYEGQGSIVSATSCLSLREESDLPPREGAADFGEGE